MTQTVWNVKVRRRHFCNRVILVTISTVVGREIFEPVTPLGHDGISKNLSSYSVYRASLCWYILLWACGRCCLTVDTYITHFFYKVWYGRISCSHLLWPINRVSIKGTLHQSVKEADLFGLFIMIFAFLRWIKFKVTSRDSHLHKQCFFFSNFAGYQDGRKCILYINKRPRI